MFRKPLFWALFALFALGCVFFVTRYFSHAFPIVNVDLKMDRAAALVQARALQNRYRFGPAGFREVASFQREQEVQNFVELEAGGNAALTAMFASGLYHPFKWSVRHFREGETRETWLWFTPRGAPYGFSIKLPEKEAGAALTPEEARSIAERSATDQWGLRLSEYRLVETSREVRPGGRVDHAFVYERPDRTIGAGRYRLRLGVGGDRLTELRHFVKVPEAFTRRYEQMRSANNVIGTASAVAMVLVYVVGGCGIGLFLLMRQRWILWRAPVAWGVFIAFLQLLAALNAWPLRWLGYDTAVSVGGFTAQQIAVLLLTFGLYAFVFSLSFMAAESLSRRAFPHHLQLWRLWDSDVAASKTMLGRTTAAYLIVPVFFAYEVVLYFVTTRWLGWWTPSDTLVEPDVLASYLPWLTPIAVSSQAGFWEESLFRAVPLAGAALIGSRLGRRNWWIAGTMIVQALVFGAGHASYATQPSYARMVELILPSFAFGGLYLAFGLWPAVVMHFAYDVAWFAIPLFVSTAPGIWVDRILLVVLALVPLWVVLLSRYRARSWTETREADFNREWRPPEPAGAGPEEAQPERVPRAAAYRYLPVAGVAGLAIWGFFAPFRTDAPPLRISRTEAETVARRELRNRGIELGPEWKVLASVEAAPGEAHRFIWQTDGRETYRSLLGTYLPEPHWAVRFARFQGDVADRAEEYLVTVSNTGQARRFRHTLPEDRAAPSLAEPEARELARRSVQELFSANVETLKEVAASPSKLKNRTDWLFTFKDTSRQLRQGETRIGVQVAGSSVVDRYRFVHVPEDWARKERDRRVVPGILAIVSAVVVAAAALAAVIAAVIGWSRRKFAVPFFVVLLAAGTVAGVAVVLNRFPALQAQFSTAQPYKVQAAMFLVGGVIAAVLSAAAIALIGGWAAAREARVGRAAGAAGPLVAALSVGTVAAGVMAALSGLGRRTSPLWADYSALGSYSSWIDAVAAPVRGYLGQAIMILLLVVAADRITRGWTRRRTAGCATFVLAGVAAAGSAESVLSWVLQAAVAALLLFLAYFHVMRFAPGEALAAVAAYELLAIARDGVAGAYPHSIPEALVRASALLATAWMLARRHRKSVDDRALP